jgi:ergothioneine biosynthesis protein EgtB
MTLASHPKTKKQERELLWDYYRTVRQASVAMCATLDPEQCRIQPIPEVSPPWWNLAHTSWFFVRNALEPFGGKTIKEDHLFDYVLNSYYVSLGPRIARDLRGLVTRPTMQEVYEYRKSVDTRMEALIRGLKTEIYERLAPIILLGLQHERQHQELFYSEIKFILYQNPPSLRIPYRRQVQEKTSNPTLPQKFISFEGGLYNIGNCEKDWGWDNEYPIHKFFVENFALQNRLITNREYMEFMDDGGYEKQLLWLDNGWNRRQMEGWTGPLYWEKVDGEWQIWTLTGMKKIDPDEPVCHVSFYEAEAFARWKEARLPKEQEWECAARLSKISSEKGNFLDSGTLHPKKAPNQEGLTQMLGEVWEWTASYYEPYPGYKPFTGNLREYNEKFMDNQRVLRGGSCVTERDHIRISYRNFWPPETRFQFTGFRLATNFL